MEEELIFDTEEEDDEEDQDQNEIEENISSYGNASNFFEACAREIYAKPKNATWDDLLFERPRWFLCRVRRHVPPPEKLYPVVEELFKTMGPSYIRKGYVPDPISNSLYYKIGVDGHELTIYRCKRGMNSVGKAMSKEFVRYVITPPPVYILRAWTCPWARQILTCLW
ncbi:MAG: hypothetical protein EXX96DRAFT_614483 [Benjaminiella poitrasii]|nr:MAG: hypothetical protein EXX96DRAFT_614483 [Benjaminiella poitrasii]